MAEILAINWIVSDPKIRNGIPIIDGTTVRVMDVAIAMIYHQQDPDGIADWYGLSLAQVHAALTYYYDHQSEIDAEIKQHSEIAQEFKEKRLGSRHSPLFG